MTKGLKTLPKDLQDEAMRRWDAFCEAAHECGLTLPEDPQLGSELRHIWAISDFVYKSCMHDPRMLMELIRTGDALRPYPRGAFTQRIEAGLADVGDENGLGREIRRIRSREMVRIAWRDLTGRSGLQETMEELSDFADAAISGVLNRLHGWFCSRLGRPVTRNGSPQSLVVIGLGKLGGRELNFSSDVDLIFAYPKPGSTQGQGPALPNEEFFSRLGRQLIKTLGAATDDGMVFRIDMRLRPYGESGPLVMSFDNMVEYYQRQGREWERYAWIKARVAAGNAVSGARLLDRLRPFVYRRYFDYGAFESLRDMKQKISREVKRKGMKDNIKLGPGGIREVEFFGQIFQLIRGGVSPILQERGIRKVLQTLAAEKTIPAAVCEELESAYVFLRRVENRIQEIADQQTHALPDDALNRQRLAFGMGFEGWKSFSAQLSVHMARVHFHFNQLLEVKKKDSSDSGSMADLKDIWSGALGPEDTRRILVSAGFDAPETVVRALEHLRNDPATRTLSPEGRKRLDNLVPQILSETGNAGEPAQTLCRMLDLIKAIQRRTNYLALLLENPEALVHLIRLTAASPWLVSFVTRHPVVLDELLDPRTLYQPPERRELGEDLRKRLDRIPRLDLEILIEELCVFKQVNTLRVAAVDVSGVLPLMRVSDHLSDIAETLLCEVLQLAWQDLTEKYGEPACLLKGEPLRQGFAVIAYGKLGGIELGYDSDLDMVFLHAAAPGHTKGGGQTIENGHFFARLGQRMVHILTTHTAAGYLYETDMRLRPSGGSGPLVSHFEGFRDYQMNRAWTWEHQAMVRARAVCGNPRLIEAFDRIRGDVLARHRDPRALQKDVGDMRRRLRRQLLSAVPDAFDLRQGEGGMVDIEFLVQYLVLLNANRFPALTEWSDNVRQIQRLAATGVIDEDTAHLLKDAYLSYRAALHRLSLQEKPALVPSAQFEGLRQRVSAVWSQHLT